MFKFFSNPKVAKGLSVIAQASLVYYLEHKNNQNKAAIEKLSVTNHHHGFVDKGNRLEKTPETQIPLKTYSFV